MNALQEIISSHCVGQLECPLKLDARLNNHPQSQVRVFLFIKWHKGEPALAHALEGPH